MRAPCGLRVWAGPIVYLIALLGIWLLANESARSLAVSLLIAAAVLAVMLWGAPKLDTRVFIRCYCADRRKPQPLGLLAWSYHRGATSTRQTFAMPQRLMRRLGSHVFYGSQA
jgi:hypothetical protein